MAYVTTNPKSKKALKEAVAAGKPVTVFSNSMFTSGKDFSNGTFTVSGPWFPEPHRWYATLTVKDGKIVKIK
jgi:hypothetical protein